MWWLFACTPPDGPDPVDPVASAPDVVTATVTVVPPTVPEPATWHGTVRALVQTHCQGCHTAGGGAPFPIESAADAASAAWAAIDGTMPPAQFDPDCRAVAGQRFLDADGRNAFARWSAAGFPDGDPADYVAPDPVAPPELQLGAPDVFISMDAPYLPDVALDDETVVFSPTFTFPDITYVTAVRVVPGVLEQVHHATVFVVDADGNPLFGDVLADSPSNALGAWAPGSPPWVMPDGAAIVVPAGAEVRLEVHYSVVSLPPGTTVVEDLTTIELWTRPDPPDEYAFMLPFNVSPITVPAADPAYVQVAESSATGLDGTLIGLTPHMHLRGTALTMELLHPDGSESCLLAADNFDFEFQELFWYEPSAWIDLAADQGVRITCTWDNSADNQPIVGGSPLPVQDVHDGPSSLDEMCQVGWMVLRPYGP